MGCCGNKDVEELDPVYDVSREASWIRTLSNLYKKPQYSGKIIRVKAIPNIVL